MRTCDPYRNIVKECIKESRRKAGRRQFRLIDHAKGHAYLEGTHLFGMSENSKLQEDRRIGTGRDIKILNELFLKQYQAEVGAEIDAGVPYGQTKSTLKRWICVEKFVGPTP